MMIDEGREKKPKDSAIVTFLIGNGFDVGLGLKTRYIDFVATYLKQPSKTDVIVKLKKKIKRDIDLWGDAELAFGKLPFSKFGGDPHLVVKECIADFSNALAEYLHNEETRFHSPDEKLKTIFSHKLFSYYQALGEYAQRNELGRLKRFHELKVNIINFNYTRTIDQMLIRSETTTFPDWDPVHVQVNPVLHVHGDLSTKYSHLFGVNDISQVEDSALEEKTKYLLVKPTIDRLAGCQLENAAKMMIDESDTVVIFGMSFGATDKIWWDYLLARMRNGFDIRLCLVPYLDCNCGASSLSEEAEWAGMERDLFYAAAGVKNDFLNRTEGLDRSIAVFLRGPYHDPDGHQVFCDPFQLGWIGKKLVAAAPVSTTLQSLT